jgi:hypothetical protein
MSDQNLLVKLVKKSVGLPTGESSCCSDIAAQIAQAAQSAQESANQGCAEQTADASSCGCSSQEAVDSHKSEAGSCGCAASQEKVAKQDDEKKQPSAVSSCSG